MSDDYDMPDETGDLAAEYALGVLTGDELRRARALARTDAGFREQVVRWSGRLSPLLDEVEPAAPPDSAWQAIERRLADGRGGPNVVELRRRADRWRGIAAAMCDERAAL